MDAEADTSALCVAFLVVKLMNSCSQRQFHQFFCHPCVTTNSMRERAYNMTVAVLVQDRAQQQAARFNQPPQAQPYQSQAPPHASAAAPAQLPADAISKAVATAKEAAARIAAQRGGAGAAESFAQPMRAQPSAAQAPQAQMGFSGPGRSDAPVPGAPTATSGAGGAGGAPRMTAEEARQVAQQAAQRVAQLARGDAAQAEDWAWSKQ
jgi:hypothetical protein